MKLPIQKLDIECCGRGCKCCVHNNMDSYL